MLNTNFKANGLPRLLLLICLFFSGLQTTLAEDINSESWHQIEYIIFQHQKSDAHVLRYENTPYPKQKQQQFSYLVKSAQPLSPYQFTRLDSSSMQLADALKKLSRRRDIKILDHGAWQQELISDVRIAPMRISKQLENNTSLFGELQIRRSRFTHAEFSIFLAESLTFMYSDIKPWFLTPQLAGTIFDLLLPISADPAVVTLTGTQKVYFNILHLKESRRIKQGEVHYLDHPALGVMVTINPIDPPEHAHIYSNTER